MRVKLYREHKYVSFALNELEREVAKTDFRGDEEIAHIQKEWQRIREMLEGHAYHEEQNFHPLLEKKGSSIHHEVHSDHEHQEETLKVLQHLLDGIKTSPDRVEAGYQFYLAYRKFVGDNLLHLHEEETKLLPELQRLCTDEELRAVERSTYNIMTVEEMIEMVQVLFPHMNFSDKCAFLVDIKLAEPQKFQHLWNQADFFLNAEEIKKIQHNKNLEGNEPSNNHPNYSNTQFSKNEYKIVVDYSPKEVDNAVVKEGSIAFNESILGERDKEFSIFLKDPLGKVYGGVLAFLGSESIYIETLWVERTLQKKGYGTQLLKAAEQEAIENGCDFSAVDTFGFQAEEFYLKNGYERIGELKNCWLGHSKMFLRKHLKNQAKGNK